MTVAGPERPGPRVDLVIPVHDPSRPIARALESLTRSGLGRDALRVTVVCHNLPVSHIAEHVPDGLDLELRLVEFSDGEPSPAGPFMHGIGLATADFVSIMGSDDELEAGALTAWLRLADERSAAAVIPPERHASGRKVTTPPTRPGRRVLDPVRDRVAYRTAPLGLLRRDTVGRLGLTMPPRLRNGSDQLFGLRLWFSGEPLVYARRTPSYIVGADAVTRVTTAPKPAADELRAVDEIVTDPWFLGLARPIRRAILVKSVRVHVFAAITTRTVNGTWTTADRDAVAGLVARMDEAEPGFAESLARADHRLLDALHSGADNGEIAALAARRRRFGTPSTLATRRLRDSLRRDAPLRFAAASFLV